MQLSASSRTGVCLVRVVDQGSGLLYTVVVNSDISTMSGERTNSFTTVDEAMGAIRTFLLAFESSEET